MTGPTALTDDDLAALLLIRHFENGVLDLFAQGRLTGTTHTCLGQEYIPVALAPLLREDAVFSNHRGHGHYLAWFDDPAGLLAELLGRRGAICHGVGGSQHVYRDRYLSTGVQGQSLPVAVGVALHERNAGEGRVAVAFVGDGTWGAGAVYEALNMAGLWRVPLVVVVENNGIAQSTPTVAQLAGDIRGRARAFGLAYEHVDTSDVNRVRERVAPLVAAARDEHRPAVVEFATRRLGPHSKGDDTRGDAELRALWAADWHDRYRRCHPEQFARVDKLQRERMADVVRDVLTRPPAEWDPR